MRSIISIIIKRLSVRLLLGLPKRSSGMTFVSIIFLLLSSLMLSSCNLLYDNFPEVVSSVPSPGEKGVAKDQEIVITFSRKMDLQKCIGAISLQPHVNGHFEQDGKIIRYTPINNWSTGTTYLLTVSQSCEDTDGFDLKEPYYASFIIGEEIVAPELVEGSELMGDFSPECANLGGSYISDFSNNLCYEKGDIRFAMEFSEAMDREATTSAFSISPSVNGSFEWSGNTMYFIPSQDLEQNTQYKISLSTLAADLNGNTISESFQRYFTTAGEKDQPTVLNIFTDAIGGAGACDASADESILNQSATDICMDQNGSGQGAVFRVLFSEEMEPAVTMSSFSLSPSVDGDVSMQNGNTELVFTGKEALLPDTQYRLTVSNSAQDVNGNALKESVSEYFTTTATDGYPQVNSIYALVGIKTDCDTGSGTPTDLLGASVTDVCEGADAAFNSFELTFSEPMNQIASKDAFSLSPSVDGYFSWDATGTVLTFHAEEKLDYGKRYELTISTGAEDLQGQKLQQKVEAEFVVIQLDTAPPGVAGVDLEQNGVPPDGCGGIPDDLSNIGSGMVQSDICVSNDIYINFDEEMDQSSVENAISFSPSVDITFAWVGNQLQVNFINPMDGDTDYTLTVSTSAKDLAGNNLQSEYALYFKTEDTAPRVRAIGVESQTNCDSSADMGADAFGLGTIIDENATSCWWDDRYDIASFNLYHFIPGDDACFADTDTDNIVLIFNRSMSSLETINAISVDRISPPSSSVEITSYRWEDNNQVLYLTLGETLATCSGSAALAAGSYDLASDANLGEPNYPIYQIEVDTTAEDTEGNSLSKNFIFAFEGN